MHEVVLLQKIHGGVSLRDFDGILRGFCEGLKVELSGLSVVGDGWVRVAVSGVDERVAVRFLENKFGLAPIVVEGVKQYSVFRGRVVGRSRMGIFVDVGVFSPEPVHAEVSLGCLQGALVDGKKFPLGRIVDLFGLVDNFPLEVRVVEVGGDGFVAELTERQLRLYGGWVGSRVDRLIVLGALCESVEGAVRRAGLGRDVIGVESLGVLEHCVVCKLGTDAVGLVSRLGRWLSGQGFVCFSPRRVLGLVGGRW